MIDSRATGDFSAIDGKKLIARRWRWRAISRRRSGDGIRALLLQLTRAWCLRYCLEGRVRRLLVYRHQRGSTSKSIKKPQRHNCQPLPMGSVNKGWINLASVEKVFMTCQFFLTNVLRQLASVVAGVRYHLDKSSNWNRMITKLVHPFFLARQLATM